MILILILTFIFVSSLLTGQIFVKFPGRKVNKMYHLEKPLKISKQLRLRAHEYLQNTKNTENLLEMIRDFEYGADQHSYLLALELIFTNLLKERSMFIEIRPFKPVENNPENLHKNWLKNVYEETFEKILLCFENGSAKIRSQGLNLFIFINLK